MPFLLVGASGAVTLPDGALLAYLWNDLASRGLRSEPYEMAELDATDDCPSELSWAPLLTSAMAHSMETPASRAKALLGAQEAIVRRIEAIVSGGHRKAYGHAAQLAVSVGEAMSLMGDCDEATSWLIGVRAMYPRHSAFKRELEAAIRRSPLVTA